MKSDQINELATALAKAQSEIQAAELDKVNPHFKSKYSSLNAIWDACRIPLSKNGLSVVQIMDSVGDQLVLVTTLAHSSGQWMKSVIPVISAKATPQALGSALTYCRRYSLSSIVGVTSDEDDDANEAQKFTPEKKQDKPTPAQLNELISILSKCSPDYSKKLKEQLSASNLNLNDVSLPDYALIKQSATNDMLEYQKVKKAEA